MSTIKTNKNNSPNIKENNKIKSSSSTVSKKSNNNKVNKDTNTKVKITKTEQKTYNKQNNKSTTTAKTQKTASRGGGKLQTCVNVIGKGYRGIKTGARTVKKGVNTVQEISSEDTIKQVKGTLKTTLAPIRATRKISYWGFKKYTNHKVKRTTGAKQNKWKHRQETQTKLTKLNNKRKKWFGRFSKVKTFTKDITTGDDFDKVKNYTKHTVNFLTKPAQKALKKGVKKILRETIKIIGKVIKIVAKSIMSALKVIITYGWPVILCILVAFILIIGSTSVFGGVSIRGSDNEVDIKETVSKIEKLFVDLKEKKANDYENFKKGVEAKVGSSQQPTKDQFEGISDEEYEKLIKEQWKKDTFVDNSISYIDYRALAVISQCYLEVDIQKTKEFIEKVDSKGILESYTETQTPIEYEVKWTKWTEVDKTTKEFTGKDKDKVVAEANAYAKTFKDSYDVEVGEPTKDKKQWKVVATITQKKGEEKTKKLTYNQYSVYINNGSFEELLAETPALENTDQMDKDTLKSFAKLSYESEYYMSNFSSEFNHSYGITVSGGEYIGGVANGKLFNWKGSEKDFEGNGFENVAVEGGGTLVGQCTWFSAGRWTQTHNGKHWSVGGNAGEWFRNAMNVGLSVGKAPRPHSIIVMSGGTSAQYAGAGHVAFIEEIEMENGEIKSITISQGNVESEVPIHQLCKEPMKHTDVRKYKSVEEYMKVWGSGLRIEGYVY